MWRKMMIAALLIVLAVSVTAPAAAQSGVVWRGEYYNNGSLSGDPTLRRNDNQIAFNWGTGSPDASISPDNFSVRWATDVALSAGTYRFYAQADDNIRIIFNFGFQPVIDTFADPSKVSQLVTGDVVVPANGTYHIQVDYREVTSTAFAYVTFANLATNPTFPGFPIGAPPTPGVPGVGVPTGPWTAQYYANRDLQGDPTAIITESTVTRNWGAGAPLVNLPPDNFSVRWSSVQNFPAGTYTFTVRSDDGVRVFVNGVLQINEWRDATGLTFSRTLTLPGGPTTIVVEYYEATGDAFIDFSITQAGVVVPPVQPPVSPAGATATVTAFRLNVRSAPNATTSSVITRVNRAEQYAIIGRSADSQWVQIDVRGVRGWVSARFVNIAPFGVNLPVINDTVSPVAPTAIAPSGNVVTANPFNVVMRRGPGTGNSRIGLLPVGASAQIVGRTADNTWWQINYNGLVGWVSAQFAIISPTANISLIPVTG